MTAISVKKFTGMVPREPDHLLEDNAASFAKDCDFSRGQLGPLRGGLEVSLPSFSHPGTNPIRSMYTLEGIFWYTWDTELTAFKSPVIDEVYSRIYYIEAGVFKVSFSPEAAVRYGGPPPSGLVYSAGVPNATVAPTLVLIERTTLADYPAADIKFKAWWSDGTKNYDPADIAHVVMPGGNWRRYAVALPAQPTSDPPVEGETPKVFTLVVQATATEGTKRLFQMNTSTDSTTASRSAALPGGITMTLEAKSTNDANGPPGFYINFEWGVVETRAYTYTMVNTWDEESGPSPVSLISPTYLQDVKVTVTIPPFGAYRPYKQTNVYRTYGGPQYIKAGFFSSGVDFIDSARVVQAGTGTALPSLSWVTPPPGMFGLILCPNGWFAAFKDNILYMSEPYRPHSWPYSMTFAKSITGICVGAQSIVVATREATSIVSGPHPAAVTSMMLPIPVGGISHRSMCGVEGGVAYLSNDGIVVVEGSQASLEVSQHYFTREIWRNLFGDALNTMTLGFHDGCVVAVSTDQPIGFILELDEAGGAMTRYDYKHTSMMRLPVLDTLYYADDTKRIYEFRKGNPLPAQWYSKQFLTPTYTKFGIGFARMSGTGQVTLALYADETLVHTEVIDPALRTKYFRLPAQIGSLKWQLRVGLTGSCRLEDMVFAQSPNEMKNV